MVGTEFGSAVLADTFFFVGMLCREMLPLKKVGENFSPKATKKSLSHTDVTGYVLMYGSRYQENMTDQFRTRFSQKRGSHDRRLGNKVFVLAPAQFLLQLLYYLSRRSSLGMHKPAQKSLIAQPKQLRLCNELFVGKELHKTSG